MATIDQPGRGSVRSEVVAPGLLLLFAALSVYSYTGTSATYDEPVHLMHGYTSIAAGDFRADPGHPPFARMLAALPLMAHRVAAADTTVIDGMAPEQWMPRAQAMLGHRFLYMDNDADQLLYRARFMIVLVGVALGAMLFLWARAWLGPIGGLAAVTMFILEPNIAAHFSLVTTDGSLACFVFGTVFFLWRTCRHGSAGNLIGLVAFFVLAIITKFSAVLLFPVAALLLAFAVFQLRTLTLARAAGIFVLLGLSAWAGVWAVYGFRHAPSPDDSWLFLYQAEPAVVEAVPRTARALAWIDEHRLLPNAYTQGLLITQALAQSREAFLIGDYRSDGWWYFFPVAILIKTPIAILLLSVCALFRRRLWTSTGDSAAPFVAVSILTFLGAAMVSNINIGLRHVLMIYPFLILLAAFQVREILASGGTGGRVLVAALTAVALLEFGSVYPHSLSFFNAFVGGPAQGAQYLVDSNLDWGQDLKGLKAWMDRDNVREVNLVYFGTADPSYYGINCVYLPGSPQFVPVEALQAPRLPGYVAVSATAMSGVGVVESRRDFYKPLLARPPVASIGHSINIYWVESPWW